MRNYTTILTYTLIIVTIFLAIRSYEVHDDIRDLRSKHYELSGKVSGIDIKLDDTSNQLRISIMSQYQEEISTAIDIARIAGYGEYKHFVFIDPLLDIVRLSNKDGTEIQIDIVSKIITTYSPL